MLFGIVSGCCQNNTKPIQTISNQFRKKIPERKESLSGYILSSSKFKITKIDLLNFRLTSRIQQRLNRSTMHLQHFDFQNIKENYFEFNKE